MSSSTAGYGIPLSDRLAIVRAYATNPLYKPLIAPLVSVFNQFYTGGLYGVLGYQYLGPDEVIFEEQLRNDANAVLKYITLERLGGPANVQVDSADVTSSDFRATVSVRDRAGNPVATRTFTVAPLPQGSVPDFDALWASRLKASKARIVHGMQNTDYEAVKQLAMVGWYYKFGRFVPFIYQIKHRMNLGAVPSETIRDRAVSAVQSTQYDTAVDNAQVKWKDKARIVLAAVNASAATVAWVIQETLALAPTG